jgi:predicted amidohydrolase YtcJ
MMESIMLVTNGKLITWGNPNKILEGIALYIDGGRIIEIDSQKELIDRHPGAEQMDALGQYIIVDGFWVR